MSIEIVEQTKVPELKRTHVVANLSFDGATPSMTQVVDHLAKALKADPKTLDVRKVNTVYGETQAKVDAFQYDSVEAKAAMDRKLPKKLAEKEEARKKAEAEAKAKAEEEAKAKAKAEEEAKAKAEAEAKAKEESEAAKAAEAEKPAEESAEAPAPEAAEKPADGEKSE